jgi:hypothetical protein
MTRQKISENHINDATDSFVLNQYLNLDLAGIMYVNAVSHYENGVKYFSKLEIEKQKYSIAFAKRAQRFQTSSDSFYTHMLPRLRNVEIAYEPVVRCFSSCKILLICSAETFINEVADVKLKGRPFTEFDKLSIVGKWIFIQDILKLKKRLTLDKNPMQDFCSLVVERNKLVHFKGMKNDLKPLEIPNFLESLKLTPKDCEKNINAVKNLIEDFSLNWSGSYGPDWLNAGKRKYRNPCFYTGNRESAWVLHSDKYDKDRHKD